ncbi:MAG: lamin tail domain-containing protein, partial [Tannerella sp.]|nr:lamin tail domain-containing protein [Tannerella sp.]
MKRMISMKRLLFIVSILILPTGLTALPEEISAGEILINEIMANPVGSTVFPATEYVEIYNVSGDTVSLNGLSFIYGSNKPVTLPDSLLPPDGYAVLFRSESEIHVDNGGIAIPLASFPSSLANEGKTLQLVNSAGVVIDFVDYSKAKPVRSWERDNSGNWYLSNDPRGGTPGAANSPKDPPPVIPEPDTSQPGDVLINEIMANPVGLTAFPETEYVEIYNVSGNTVSLEGWSFVYDGKPITLPDRLLPPDGYAVLFRSGYEIHIDNGGIAIPVATFPDVLSDEGETVKLVNSVGLTIDSVVYDTAKDAQSWERDSFDNWYLSTDPRGGTPGAVNSLKDPPPVIPEPDVSQSGDVLINEIMADTVGLTAFPKTEYVEIYNTSSDTVSLDGWSFVYDGKPVTLPDSLLPPDGYAVLFRSGREIHVEIGGIAIPLATFPFNLANTGKTVKLVNSAGLTVDTTDYAAAKPAQSWERDSIGNWYLSTDPRGGTPGAVNSLKDPPPVIPEPDTSQPGDVLINEIMANPVGLTAFPETEYVEIYNASGNLISLKGWSFVYDGRAVALPDSLLPDGAYAVLFRSGREIHVDTGGIAIPVATFPAALANDGKTLQLVNSAGIVIDSANYVTAKAAQSWERDSAGNWYLSNDSRGGTPGAVNSPKDIPVTPIPDVSQPGDVLINEIMANPVGLTAFPETEYVEIHNASGNLISLKGWSFVYDGRAVALPDSLLPDGAYAVLFRSGREILVDNGGIAIPVATFPAALANDGKTLQLLNSAGIVIDSANY